MTISLISYIHTLLPIDSSMKKRNIKAISGMKVDIQSRKLIKPSISTPPTLRHYKISFIDEFAPKINIPLVLFFSPNTDYDPNSIPQLEESLGKTLTHLYPLAGRYMKDIHMVDCNDQGVEFIQAQVDITIQDILDPKGDPNMINEFVPSNSKVSSIDQVTDPILATQLTMFKCGGLALGVSMSHRIGDMSSLITFLNQWATLNRRNTKVQSSGKGFTLSPLFPARGLPPVEVGIGKLINKDDYVTKILSFNESAISKIKSKVTSSSNGKINTHQLFKVQLVASLIWKAFIGVDLAIYGHPRDSILIQPISLPEKGQNLTSLMPKHTFGNKFALISTKYASGTIKTDLQELTGVLIEDVMKTVRKYSKAGYDNNERTKLILNSFSDVNNIPDTTNVIWLSSWSKFPYYDVNFGFGKPIWVSCGFAPINRGIVLMDDARGKGLEAYVTMGVRDVPYLERDEDIIAFSV